MQRRAVDRRDGQIGAIDRNFAVAGMISLILTALGLLGNLARLERRIFFIELDALLIIFILSSSSIFCATNCLFFSFNKFN